MINEGSQSNKKIAIKLPKSLKFYINSDYTIQLKTRFIYYLILSALFLLTILILSSSYTQLNNPAIGKLYLPVLIPELITFLIIIVCLILLLRGNYGFAAHLFMISAFLSVWAVIYFYQADIVARLDTIVIIIALMSLAPLFITKFKLTVFIYLIGNIVVLIGMVYLLKDDLGFTHAAAIEFIMDNSIAIIFTGIVGYSIFNIHKQTLKRVELDYKERIRAEIDLANTEERYKSLIEASKDGIVLIDLYEKILFVNNRIIEMMGVDNKENIIGNSFLTFFIEKDRAIVKNILLQLSHLGHIENLLLLGLRSDGASFPVEINFMTVKGNDGGTNTIMANVRDISKRIKDEEEHRESELRYKNLFENAQIGIYQTTPDGKVLNANPAILRLLGLDSFEEIKSINLEAEEHFDNFGRSRFKNLIEKNGIVQNLESKWIKKNGEIINVIENAKAVKDAEGKILYYDGFVENITEKKKAELALRESEEKYRTLMESLNEVIIVADNDHVIQFVNKKFTEILGYKPEEIIGKVGFKILHDPIDYHLIEKANKERKDKKLTHYELPFLTKDGRKIDMLVSGSPVIHANGNTIASIGAMVDITERKKAEKALVESERKFREMADLLPIAVWETDLNGICTYTNKVGFDIHNYTHEDFLAKVNILTLLIPEDRERASENLKNRIHGAPITGEEYIGLKKDGRTFPVRVYTSVIYENQKPIGFRGVTVDITKVKEAEKELKESEEKYRTLMENLNDVIMMVDNDDQVLYVNRKFTEKLGYTADEIVGKIGYQVLLDTKYHDSIKKVNQERLKKEISQYELQFIAKNGTRIDFLISGAPVVNSDGETIGSIRAMVDITDRKKAEQALKESEEKYRTIIEAFPDIIMISDLNSNIIFANSVLEKITGITQDDYSNPNRLAHIHPEDVHIVKNAMNELLSGQKTHTGIIENRFIDSWGNLHWFSGIMSKLTINNQTYLQTISRDITEKKSVEKELDNYRQHLEFLVQERTDELATTNEELVSTNEELLNQREELEAVLINLQNTQKQLVHAEKMASLGVLAAGVAHEINNPLNFIKGGVVGLESYLDENLKPHLEELAPLIEGMNIGIDRAAAIVTSLNHYSRKDDKPAIKCDVHSVIDNCLIMLQNQIKHKIEITKKYTTKPHVLVCNEGKLHQAILNVLSNAVQAIEEKGKITIKTDSKDDKIKLVISDTGCGISKENLPKILDPFFTTKEPGKGTGLGLSITYNIIQEHNGTIEFESTLNKGTTVIIKLPLNK